MARDRGWTSASALVVAASLCAAPRAALADEVAAPDEAGQESPPADPAAEAYKLHMSNGVKLFQDKNFAAAIVEFQAAYDAKPKASPLINIALCHKGLFHYPKAVAALRAAVDKHADTMEDGDKRAAEQAIAEMSALLAYVTVRVSPEHAVLSIDGEDLPAGATQRPIPLGPGPHRITARASGHANAEAQVAVASGDKSKTVALELLPDKGFVRVRAQDAQTAIAIDQKPLGRGTWEGYVAPGTHVVQLYKTGGSSAALEILVAAGRAQEIARGEGGSLKVNALSGVPFFGKPAAVDGAIEAPPDLALGVAKAGEKAGGKAEVKDPPLKGFYGHVTATAVSLVTGGPTLNNEELRGYSVGARGGYRLSTAFGLELSAEYSNLSANEDLFEANRDVLAASKASGGYDLDSIRLGGNIRFMTPGYRARFVATLGLGMSYDIGSLLLFSTSKQADIFEANGANVYFTVEQGVEFNIRHALLGLTIQQTAGTTGRFVERSQFGGGQLTIGFGLRVGYGRW